MKPQQVIQQTIEFCHMVVDAYINDLKDAELMVRPVPGANHIAWQLGHLISGDHEMLAGLGHKAPALPADFAAAYTKETASSDDAKKFHPLKTYLELTAAMKAAKLAAVAATPDATLDQPSPEHMRSYAPKIADMLSMLGTHWLMHAGQFVIVRRKLGKPALF